MRQFGIPTALGFARRIYTALTGNSSLPPTAQHDTTLVTNFRTLRDLTRKPDPRRVAFLGQAGAGKSTIVDKLSMGHAHPRPVIGVHTNATNWAQRTDVDLLCRWPGLVAADCPGYDTRTHPVAAFVTHFPFANFDKIVLVIHGKIRAADVDIYQAIRHAGMTPLVVRSHAESLDASDRDRVTKDLCRHLVGLQPNARVFVSSRNGEGIGELRSRL